MHGEFRKGQMHIIGHDDFFGQFLFPGIVVQVIHTNPFLFTFILTARPFHMGFPLEILVRLHVLEEVMRFTKRVYVIEMILLMLLQTRKEFVEADLCQ